MRTALFSNTFPQRTVLRVEDGEPVLVEPRALAHLHVHVLVQRARVRRALQLGRLARHDDGGDGGGRHEEEQREAHAVPVRRSVGRFCAIGMGEGHVLE